MLATTPPLPTQVFARDDDSDDALFYARPRLVRHLDRTATSTVEALVEKLVVEPSPEVLDLMASWDSHLPQSLTPARVVGLGLNADELARNARLDERVIHDVNRDPRLPFDDASFDVVLNTAAVDYLTRPREVFSDVRRILRPGGLLLVIFSNRWFEPKVTHVWRATDEEQRIVLVQRWLAEAGGFWPSRTFVSRGLPRPADDKYAPLGVPSDPVYAVFADREGHAEPRKRPLPAPARRRSREEVRRRAATIAESLRCPHCDSPLRKWAVPQTPFTEWPNEFMYGCFNDACPYIVDGWGEMGRQGNSGWSYRLIYDPENGAVMPLPVPHLNAMKDNIIE